jgi:hypothetical protein
MMKKALVVTLGLLCISSLAFAQAGSLGLFVDSGGTDCDAAHPASGGYFSLYVYHLWSPGATAARFMVDHSSWGCDLVHFADQCPMGTPLVGNSDTGVAVTYGMCMASPAHILTIVYQGGTTTGSDCCLVQVVGDPALSPPIVQIADCDDPPQLFEATGGGVILNPIPGVCECSVATQPTSWGQIKALYR